MAAEAWRALECPGAMPADVEPCFQALCAKSLSQQQEPKTHPDHTAAVFVSGNWYDPRKAAVVAQLITNQMASRVYISGGVGRLTPPAVAAAGGEHIVFHRQLIDECGLDPAALVVVADGSAKHTGDNCDQMLTQLAADGGVDTLYIVEESFLMRRVYCTVLGRLKVSLLPLLALAVATCRWYCWHCCWSCFAASCSIFVSGLGALTAAAVGQLHAGGHASGLAYNC